MTAEIHPMRLEDNQEILMDFQDRHILKQEAQKNADYFAYRR